MKKIELKNVEKLLDEIDSYNENKHHDRSHFEKHLKSQQVPDIYGLFDGGKCTALAFVEAGYPEPEYAYLQELASFFPGKGCGMMLVEKLAEKYETIWLISNPTGGEGIAKNYRNTGLFNEFVIDKSVYSGKPLHIFMKLSGNDAAKKQEHLERFLTGIFAEG